MVNIHIYMIVGKNLYKHYHDTIVTSKTIASIINETLHGIKVKQEPNDQVRKEESSLPIPKSTFVGLCDFFNKDGTFFHLHTSSQVSFVKNLSLLKVGMSPLLNCQFHTQPLFSMLSNLSRQCLIHYMH